MSITQSTVHKYIKKANERHLQSSSRKPTQNCTKELDFYISNCTFTLTARTQFMSQIQDNDSFKKFLIMLGIGSASICFSSLTFDTIVARQRSCRLWYIRRRRPNVISVLAAVEHTIGYSSWFTRLRPVNATPSDSPSLK